MRQKLNKKDYWLRVSKQLTTTGDVYRTYITRHGNRINYMSTSEVPLALSNLVSGEAAELMFQLEQARDSTDAANAVRNVLREQWRNNMPLCPKVEIMS